MSLESNVARSVIDLGEVVKTETITAVARANSEGKLSLTDEDLSVLATIVGGTIESTILNRLEVVTRLLR